jgi:hypothetical protein
MSHSQWYPNNVNQALAGGGETSSLELYDSWSQLDNLNHNSRTAVSEQHIFYLFYLLNLLLLEPYIILRAIVTSQSAGNSRPIMVR